MGAERLQDKIELYRFNENKGTFTGVCTIIYDRDKAFIKGLHGTISTDDKRELEEHLRLNGVKEVCFVHNKRFKAYKIKPSSSWSNTRGLSRGN
tara:strand:+ start:107 stop:388 length:282 start_codon:yes stop_codon:yes gene_type:complete